MDGLSITGINKEISGSSPRGSVLETKSLSASEEGKNSFGDTLNEAIGKVNELHIEADQSMKAVATGKSNNLHETMIKTEQADLALKLMVQVRNKIIDAYREVMKMQV